MQATSLGFPADCKNSLPVFCAMVIEYLTNDQGNHSVAIHRQCIAPIDGPRRPEEGDDCKNEHDLSQTAEEKGKDVAAGEAIGTWRIRIVFPKPDKACKVNFAVNTAELTLHVLFPNIFSDL